MIATILLYQCDVLTVNVVGKLMKKVDVLLEIFIKQEPMNLQRTVYTPCYKIMS